jgi:hypothetical protein
MPLQCAAARRRLSTALVLGAFAGVSPSSPSLAAESERAEAASAPSDSVVFTGAAAGLASFKGDMGPWLERASVAQR